MAQTTFAGKKNPFTGQPLKPVKTIDPSALKISADPVVTGRARVAGQQLRRMKESWTKEQQVKHNTALSMLGVIGELSTDKSVKRLTGVIEQTGSELPVVKASIAALGIALKP